MTVDVTRLVYAVPLVALAVAVLATIARSATRNAGTRTQIRRRPRYGAGIVIGVAGLSFSAFMFASADADLRQYSSDPSCAGRFAPSGAAGACRHVSGYIADYYWTSGRGAHRDLVLRFADGTQQTVAYGRDRRGSVWYGAMNRNDRSANLELFRDRVVDVETASGSATTSSMPIQRFDFWAIFGVSAGVIGIVNAIAFTFSRPSLA